MIELANLMERGNVLEPELAIAFLSELDGLIQSDIMLLAPEEIVVYDNVEQELMLKPPHDQLYVHYLVAMIRQVQQEFEGYNNAQDIVNEKLAVFRKWYISRYRPADTLSRGYIGGTSAGAGPFAYLSAYGTAVKLGFTGTEAEWLESLKGETGEAARMRYEKDTGCVQWGVGGVWTDLYSLEEIIGPVVAATLEQAQKSADAAGVSAGTAANAAAAAKENAVTAQRAAQEAKEAAARAQAGGGGSISVAGAGDDIVITTTISVRADGDDIILGG